MIQYKSIRIKAFFLLHCLGILSLYYTTELPAQELDLEQSINTYRKGTISVKASPGAEVEIEQLSHEFWFGCALANGIFSGSASEEDIQQYRQKFLENFNSAVTENAVKWGNMERQKGQVNYSVVDAMLEWTDANEIPLRAHNLFWGIPNRVQPWLKEMTDEELEQTLKERAITITSRYKGRFAEYDLNNEMIHGNYYEDRLGPGITKKMTEWATTGDPDIILYLNDYDILTGNMLDKYLEHIRLLLSQDVPIAGIGVQGHLHSETFNRNELKRALDSLAQFDLPIRITEFNMPGQRSEFHRQRIRTMTPEQEELNVNEMVDYYKICFAHSAVEGILMWGFWEGANWIPVSSLYKRDWSPTPALTAYQNLIFKEWWTKEKGIADSNGDYSVKAFYGNYKVTVNGQTKNIELKRTDREKSLEF